jgi:hypothetical protein
MTLDKSLAQETLTPQEYRAETPLEDRGGTPQTDRPSEVDPRHPDNAPAELEYNPNEVIIKFKPGVQTADIATLQSNLRATTLETTQTLGSQLWQIQGMTADEVVAAYANDPRIEYLSPTISVL